MKNTLNIGDKKSYSFVVRVDDYPALGGKVVHKVCSTFVLVREIEWTTRLFMLDIIEDDEEGIGTMVEIHHKSPALKEEVVEIEAELLDLRNGHMTCSFEAKVNGRIIALGKTGQKLLKKEKLRKLYSGEDGK